jgi:hypothetical protein
MKVLAHYRMAKDEKKTCEESGSFERARLPGES